MANGLEDVVMMSDDEQGITASNLNGRPVKSGELDEVKAIQNSTESFPSDHDVSMDLEFSSDAAAVAKNVSSNPLPVASTSRRRASGIQRVDLPVVSGSSSSEQGVITRRTSRVDLRNAKLVNVTGGDSSALNHDIASHSVAKPDGSGVQPGEDVPAESSNGAGRTTRRASFNRRAVAPIEPPAPAPPPEVVPASRKVPTARRQALDAKGKGKAKQEPEGEEQEEEEETPIVVAAVTAKGGRKGGRKSSTSGGTEASTSAPALAPRRKVTKRLSASTTASTSKRSKLSHSGPVLPYTHPLQVPDPPQYGSSLSNYLESYTEVEVDDFPAAYESKAEYEADILAQVEAITSEGRTLFNPDRSLTTEPKRAKDHQEWLLDHALYFSKLVSDERKSHILTAKKIGKMVLSHFERKKGQKERGVKEVTKNQKALAKWTAKEVGKKWKMAINVVKSRRKERIKAEQDRIGKIQLNAMLDKSTTMLQAQQVEMAGESESESESDSSEEEDDDDNEEEEEDESVADSAESSTAAPLNRQHLSRSRTNATPSSLADAASVESDAEPVGEDFEAPEDAARMKEDEAWEEEMENEEGDDDDSDSEMGGLAADAEMSIEELMRISGYPPAGVETPAESEAGDTPVPSVSGDVDLTTAEDEEAEATSEFGSVSDGARDDEDEKFAEEMDAEAGDSDDSEMDGLAEDADLPIEELMRKYGAGAANGVAEIEEEEDGLPLTNGKHHDSDAMTIDSPVDGEEEVEEEEEADEEDGISESGVVADRVHLRPPFLLRGSLRPYQQAGLEWLAGLYATGVNGILADEMGLGKTIQTISLLAHLACDKGQWGPHLVVVPTSVMLNWEMEFKKFLPGFKILTYYGTQKERKEKRKGWNSENAFHVCVTSYQLVLADQSVFRRKPWHYMILDEAHHIKNFRSQRWQTLLGFNARHRLLLTGTPLQNNLMELWSLLYFLMPAGLTQDGKGPFADSADFQAWFSNPMEKAIENGEAMDEETKATVSKLHTILRPYLLRRLKSEVEKQMPGKTESIIYCRLSKRQRFLYDDFMSRSQTRETLGSGHFLSIINCLMQLRKVCNHPDLFEVRPIVTSFAMSKSVAMEYEVKELLVRKKLLFEEPIGQMDWSSLTIIKPDRELSTSSFAAQSIIALDAAPRLSSLASAAIDMDEPPRDTKSIAGWKRYLEWSQVRNESERLERMAAINTRRCVASSPRFGHELLHLLRAPSRQHALLPIDVQRDSRTTLDSSTILPRFVKSFTTRAEQLDELVSHFGFVTPKVKAADMPRHALAGLSPAQIQTIEKEAPVEILQKAGVKLSVAFPDRSLLQYDCGKLQKLDELLRECIAGGHRVLIFTQMTKVLDILEIFLSFHGHRYLRLDGSTNIEQRQIITERFNSNDRILCFISSTRSGGLGINLQGADTVIFYDSDWNPALDRQCQDRAHRIGQTREVRIWRFVTEHSIEENMLKKANQKRRLDEMVIADGDFTTDYLQKLDWRDYLDDGTLKELGVDDETAVGGSSGGGGGKESAAEIRQALAAAEDEEDSSAAKIAEGEMQMEAEEFNEVATTAVVNEVQKERNEIIVEEEEEEQDPLAGTVDGYMINFVEEHYALFD